MPGPGPDCRRGFRPDPAQGCFGPAAFWLYQRSCLAVARCAAQAPVNAAILHGDEETGVTIMVMDVGLDTGPMLSKRSIRLTRDETAGSAFEKLSQLGAGLLTETLPNYLSGKLTPTPQPEEGVTYAPMIKKEEGRLDFSQNAEALERRVRAFNPCRGAFMDFDGTLLKIHRARVEGAWQKQDSGLLSTTSPRSAGEAVSWSWRRYRRPGKSR